jgi:hydrogenase maturation protease
VKTLVVGLGNPILGDDGVGWKVAQEVESRLQDRAAVMVECLSLGGLSLMERLIGYDRAIIVDAFSSDRPAGTVFCLDLAELPNYSSFHTSNPHDTSLQNALAFGRALGAHLPKQVQVVGLAVRRPYDFSEALTPEVGAAVPGAVRAVLNLIDEMA